MKHIFHPSQKMKHLQKYWPLFALIIVAIVEAFAIEGKTQSLTMTSFMHNFMGFFLSQFALLKIFHPKKFAEGFQKYDLIAAKSRFYALCYPLIELSLGLGYLAFFFPIFLYIMTILILGIGTFGVIKALIAGLDVRCACMGTVLDVPLSTVTLTENLGMIAMATILLVSLI